MAFLITNQRLDRIKFFGFSGRVWTFKEWPLPFHANHPSRHPTL